MMKIFTKEYLETQDIETLSDILMELCEHKLGYSDEQIDELFEDTIKRDDNFELDKEDTIDWIIRLQKPVILWEQGR